MTYKEYLASREWALKREAIRKRSSGVCERCHNGPYEATHHLHCALHPLRTAARSMLTTERPPIANHPCWSTLRFNLQPFSKNQRRFPLVGGKTPTGVRVPCICGELFDPFREGSMFFTAPGHRSCAATPRARRWAAWAKVEIGKLTGVMVQDDLYDI